MAGGNEGMGRRPLSRLIVGAALIFLGAVSAWRLPLAFLPSWSFPELSVMLRLPDSEDLEGITPRYLVPLESSIRAVGGVREAVGTVDGDGGRWRVRFDPGVDIERKAARLDSELESLRRLLPERALLVVDPAAQGGGEQSTLVWLPEERRSDPRLVEALRSLPTVSEVVVAGERGSEVRVVARDGRQDMTDLRRAVMAGPLAVGTVSLAGRRLRVMSEPVAGRLLDRPVRRGAGVVPLGGLARVDLLQQDPVWQAHVAGKSGQVLLISREVEASPIALRQQVLSVLEAFDRADASILVDEAEPLLVLLRSLALGGVSAMLLLAVFGWFRSVGSVVTRISFGLAQASLIPLAAAAALNALWLAGFSLDVTTVPALTLAVASAVLLSALRVGPGDGAGWMWLWMSLAAAALPITVVLAGGPVGALLAAPARALALAVPAAGLAIFLLSPPSLTPPHPRSFTSLRWFLRRPWAVLLATGSVSYGLLVVFSGGLIPKPGSLSPVSADLSLALSFPRGLSAKEAEQLVQSAEAILEQQPEVRESWSVFDQHQGTLGIRVVDAEKPLPRLRAFGSRLELQLRPLGASVRATSLAGAGGSQPLRFDDELIEPPEVDESKTSYRLILRSADSRRLRVALERLEEARNGHSWLKGHLEIVPDWEPPAEQWVLVPKLGSNGAARQRALSMLSDRGRLPAARPGLALPGDSQPISLRVVDAVAPVVADEPLELQALLAAQDSPSGVLTAGELFDVETSLASPTLMRQGGSFVLPITVNLRRLAMGNRLAAVDSLHNMMRTLRWPSGVDRELPNLKRTKWTRKRVRLIAVASALPVLLAFLSVLRLSSLALGVAAGLAPGVALAALSLFLFAGPGGPDELAILAIGGTLAVVWAMAAEVVSASRTERPSPLGSAAGYRWLARRLPSAAGVAAVWPALLLLPTLGLDSDRHAWVTAFRSAGLAGSVGIAASFLFLPVVLRVVDRVRFHDRKAAKVAASPIAWRQEQQALELSVKNLNKIYDNGFQALSNIDFRLEPGIVGLLGPNGAGKTTLLRCLCGLLGPTRGQVLFRGESVTPENLPRYRRLVGFLPQSFNAYEGFTVEAFLDFWALEKGIREPVARQLELQQVLESVGLTDAAGRRVRELSGGMRRRIGIARALLGAPPILIVDEPTTGLDVESRNRLRESLLQAAGDRIILFSTHIASDVAAAASRILILDRGRLSFDGSAAALIDAADGRVFETLLEDSELREFSSRFRVTTRIRTLEGIRVRAVAGLGQEPAGSLVRPNLEEAYLAKLGQMPGAPGGVRDGGSLLDLGS